MRSIKTNFIEFRRNLLVFFQFREKLKNFVIKKSSIKIVANHPRSPWHEKRAFFNLSVMHMNAFIFMYQSKKNRIGPLITCEAMSFLTNHKK